MPKTAQPLTVSDQDDQALRRWTRSSSIRAGLAQRARIVLAAAEGLSNTRIAEQIGCSRPTVIHWRGRYAANGLAGLDDQPRSGRPRTVRRDRRAEIVALTHQPPPQTPTVGHHPLVHRALARHLGVSRMTVARVWAEHDLKPWRTDTFKFSTDPQLEAKVADLCGLYLAPPAGAVVLCVDEKTQIQALDRTAPILPVRPGLAERRTHDWVRHGSPTCSRRWRLPPARCWAAAFRGTARMSSWSFSSRSPARGRGGSCMWCATTPRRTPTARSPPGWPATPGSGCISRRRLRAGCTRSRPSLGC